MAEVNKLAFDDFDAHVADMWIERPAHTDVPHAVFGLLEEAGEVAGKFKRAYRGDNGTGRIEVDHVELAKELGDTLYYLTKVAHLHGYLLIDIAQMNIDKLRERKARTGTLTGSGDNR